MPRILATRFVFVAFFVFCQVIGVLCDTPDLVMTSHTMVWSEAPILCPMDSGFTCSPLLTSSPDRHAKSGTGIGFSIVSDAHLSSAFTAAITLDRRSIKLLPPFRLSLSEFLKVLRI